MSHLSRSLITEAKLYVKKYESVISPFEDRDAFVIGLTNKWYFRFTTDVSKYSQQEYRALKKKARRYVRAALSEMYPTRMFMRSMKHSARFAYLKLKNSI